MAVCCADPDIIMHFQHCCIFCHVVRLCALLYVFSPSLSGRSLALFPIMSIPRFSSRCGSSFSTSSVYTISGIRFLVASLFKTMFVIWCCPVLPVAHLTIHTPVVLNLLKSLSLIFLYCILDKLCRSNSDCLENLDAILSKPLS